MRRRTGPGGGAALGAGALAALGVGVLGYATLVERQAYVVRRFTIRILPAATAPIRLLHLSDLHLLPGQRRKLAWVRRLADWGPDVVVDTGDNIAHPGSIEPLLETLAVFDGLPGAFVLGSNDYYAPGRRNPVGYLTGRVVEPRTLPLPTDALVAGLEGLGWTNLTNARGRWTLPGADVGLVGVDDPHVARDDYVRVAGRPDPADAVTIGVTHAPYRRVLDAMAGDGVQLILAGHTHGGQLALPGYGALVTNCDLDRRRAKGLSRWWPGAGAAPSSPAPAGAAWLHVSAGLGTSPYAPARFACRPEASQLTLLPRRS